MIEPIIGLFFWAKATKRSDGLKLIFDFGIFCG
jgi:hypothetical protein